LLTVNLLCLATFFGSLFMLLRGISASHGAKPSALYGSLCIACLVYFFSIFGVWFVHTLLEGDDSMGVGASVEVREGESTANLEPVQPAEGAVPGKHVAGARELRELRTANDRLARVSASFFVVVDFVSS
jgi:hypothetical protein